MNKIHIYECPECKDIIIKYQSETELNCCNQIMKELVPNEVEASLEKHIPEITKAGNNVHVNVGSVTHPMTEEHYIAWILLEEEQGYQIRYLEPSNAPEADFVSISPKAIYEYCTLHGLWKTELEK